MSGRMNSGVIPKWLAPGAESPPPPIPSYATYMSNLTPLYGRGRQIPYPYCDSDGLPTFHPLSFISSHNSGSGTAFDFDPIPVALLILILIRVSVSSPVLFLVLDSVPDPVFNSNTAHGSDLYEARINASAQIKCGLYYSIIV
ncbi:hypothetical protein EVAR_80770_1 [Eumeta japonica]|uniref:Uncharacterized protein n=1 Tax=Eumeta variegata TaxID=151549 RepID=A0A4C1X8D5_EUMVA|nr:hypothetical protein EVAR_80770_1 [Eumeta japonica]